MQSMQSVQEQKEYLPDVGYIIESQLLLSEKEVVDGAKFIGDLNPVHNDPDNEQTIRLGGIIASGSHITAVFSALLPTHFKIWSYAWSSHGCKVHSTDKTQYNLHYELGCTVKGV